jgi:hypothetical protein
MFRLSSEPLLTYEMHMSEGTPKIPVKGKMNGDLTCNWKDDG